MRRGRPRDGSPAGESSVGRRPDPQRPDRRADHSHPASSSCFLPASSPPFSTPPAASGREKHSSTRPRRRIMNQAAKRPLQDVRRSCHDGAEYAKSSCNCSTRTTSTPTPIRSSPDRFLRARLKDHADLVAFAQSLLTGVLRNRGELDAMLSASAANWRLERMAATDRNILRIGAYEILYTDTPDRVCINEAVELAKRFRRQEDAQVRQRRTRPLPPRSSRADVTRATGTSVCAPHGRERTDPLQPRGLRDEQLSDYSSPLFWGLL